MKVKLRNVLMPVSRSEPVESEKRYRILGVKWYAKGAWVKKQKYGVDIKANNVYRVQEGDLIYNRLFAWKGSFAIIPRELDGNYVSNEFPALRCSEEMAYLDYVFLFLSQYDVWAAIDKLSTGVASISRKRLKVQELLNIEILLPPKNIQQKIINKYSQIDSFYSQLIKLQDKNALFVKKLRQAILQLAVQGKLAPQDPNDESASELLKRIKAEKENLIAEGKIRKQKPLSPITENEIPYELPQCWEWVRLGNIVQVSSGDGLTSKNMDTNGTIPVYGGNGITGYHNKHNVNKQTIVIGRVGYYCGSIHLTQERAWVTDNAFITKFPETYIDQDFLIWLLKGTDLKKNENATAQPVISGRKIYPIIIGIPPLAEQKRIIAKVDQLMHLCDELETRFNQSKKDSEMLMRAVLHEAFSERNQFGRISG
jgi:restriction endonuclease S subunit